jgi:DNA repair protein RecN (Recombination protein N)
MEAQLLILEKELNRLAQNISQNRHQQTETLKENLETLLKQLGIPEAQIIIKLEDLPALGNMGKDAMEIYFSANRGSRPGPVSQVASGGELSRLMLCFKYLLADNIFLPTIIFDEIDTGVSGEVAIQVGRIMKKLSGNHQLMCITHNPQVAAMGAHQYRVYKVSGDDITTTHISRLSNNERIEEIAQMIAGHKPSSLAIENAKELLAAAS